MKRSFIQVVEDVATCWRIGFGVYGREGEREFAASDPSKEATLIEAKLPRPTHNYFFGCNRKARKVLNKYAAPHGQKVWFGWRVPADKYWEVYEGVMHDPVEPQCVTRRCWLGLVIDTPGR